MDGIQALIIACGVALLLFLGGMVLHRANSPTFNLYKDDWQCVKTHNSVRFQPVGKVMVPITDKICDQYNRK